MTEQPAPKTAKTPDDRAWARPLFERQIALLGQLAEAGLEVAVAIKDKVVAGEGDAQALAMAYGRVARAVRMTILLQSKLIKQLQDWDNHGAHLASHAVADAGRQQQRLIDARKARTVRIVERVAQAQHDDAEHIEHLVEETAERLDHDDIYGEVLSRPVSELIAMICKDLGLDPDWPRLAEEAWAKAELDSGAAGTPLKTLAAGDLERPGDGPPPRTLGRPPDAH